MMSLLEAFYYGVIQGVTEFLPISSSAHLSTLPLMVGMTQSSVTFMVFLHFGTLLSVVLFFRKELFNIIKYKQTTLLINLFIATIPAVIIGLLLKEPIEQLFYKPSYIALFLIFTAILLYIAERKSKNLVSIGELTKLNALIIGIAQAVALAPGISRSGITLSAALLLGLKKGDAFNFALLLSIPAIIAATLLKSVEVNITEYKVYLVGTITSFIIGYLSLMLLSNFVRRSRLKIFSIYCIIFALLILTIIRV